MERMNVHHEDDEEEELCFHIVGGALISSLNVSTGEGEGI